MFRLYGLSFKGTANASYDKTEIDHEACKLKINIVFCIGDAPYFFRKRCELTQGMIQNDR